MLLYAALGSRKLTRLLPRGGKRESKSEKKFSCLFLCISISSSLTSCWPHLLSGRSSVFKIDAFGSHSYSRYHDVGSNFDKVSRPPETLSWPAVKYCAKSSDLRERYSPLLSLYFHGFFASASAQVIRGKKA